MPTYKNVTLSLRSSAHETAPLLEFPPPPHLPIRVEDVASATAAVYVLASPGLGFWIAYHVKPPVPPDTRFFVFKLFMDGRHVVSWAVGEEDEWKGKTMFGLFENHEWRGGVEKRAFAFACKPERDVDAVTDHESRVLEVRVFRAGARKRIQREAPELIETEVGKDGAGGIDLVNAGCLKKENPKRFYRFALIDSLKKPYVTFRYYYRSLEQLKTLGVVIEGGDGEDEAVTDSGNGFQDLDLSFLSNGDANSPSTIVEQPTTLDRESPPLVAQESLNSAVSSHNGDPKANVPSAPTSITEAADLMRHAQLVEIFALESAEECYNGDEEFGSDSDEGTGQSDEGFGGGHGGGWGPDRAGLAQAHSQPRPNIVTERSVAKFPAGIVTASSLTPPVLPLTVRTPYMSTWLNNARDEPWSKWPMFWTGDEIGFSLLAAVPDTHTVYPLLGRPHDSLDPSGHGEGYNVSRAIYKGAKYDASTTNLTYSIPAPSHKHEPLELVLSFLSPITPTSTLRQSIPASYVSVHVTGTFDIDVYIDVNGQWVSGHRDARIVWDFSHNALDEQHRLKTFKVTREEELLFTENRFGGNAQAEWGSLYFTAPSDVRHECGTSAILRQRFSATGTLENVVDDAFRSIMDEEPVFAFSKSFRLSGNSSEPASDSVVFTMAHIQDEVVQFASARGLTYMRPLWKSWFGDVEKLLTYHYLDFANAVALADKYSAQLAIDAYQSGSENYVDIVALSARQVMGATSFSGTPENPVLFLKEISSNGNSQTVDVIFPAWPFFLYTNPRWGAWLLEPLIEHMNSGQYPNDYSMHDLGSHFPNMTGYPDGNDEYMPVEECGDMLIMGLSLVNSLTYGNGHESQSIWATMGSTHYDEEAENPFHLTTSEYDGFEHIDSTWGGGAKGAKQAQKWLSKSYNLWQQWTGYLVEFSLRPHNQLSTDDFAGWLALHSNLALKGIVGIKAMSEMAATLENDEDNISEVYVEKWQGYAISRDGSHVKLAYDWYGSWTTIYSLYADALLCFHPTITNTSAASAHHNEEPYVPDQKGSGSQSPLKHHHDPSSQLPGSRKAITSDFIPHHVYKIQSDWYAAVMQEYGLPLDSRHLYTKSDWEFEAAAVTSKKVRSDLLNRVATWLNETGTDRPFTDLYETESGEFPGPHFFARPVVGGHFAFLALERACGGTGMAPFDAWEE
ncbi:putative glutaminase a protein [Neofusicoccum parvum UCRNP2]|uniref:Putative glutaminase a protein n=1 Tax=Botryosphaeria parva (strain UCR-NP2) TaxID=1287680 RepID=R1EYL4_BOTPV|nr:putative glutaminase a protein [Neofusicoccum parvum UCRNP2]